MKVGLAFCPAIVLAVTCFAQSAERLPPLQSIDVTLVDSSVSPCENFYQYTCGKLNAANPIPPDQASWGSFMKLAEWNRRVLQQILEANEAAGAARTPNEQKIGDFYGACMDQASSKANDLSTIEPLLAQIEAMRSKDDIPTVLAAIHQSLGRAWAEGNNQTDVAMFGFGPTPDANDVRRVVAGLDQGGLGMPSRDYYLSDLPALKGPRERYQALIVALLKMNGASAETASQQAATIMRLETAMAQAQMDNITRRDPNKVNNRYTLVQLKTLTPAFPWDSYLKSIGVPASPLYEVSAPEFFRRLNKLLADEDLVTWKLYLSWQLLFRAAPVLGNSWRDAYFTYSSALTGQHQQPPDWRRCALAVDNYLGEALGQVYVSQVFPPESKVRVEKMIKQIEAAMGRDLDAVTWMQPATKREAHLKLAAVLNKIGYPENWIDYSSLNIARESFPLDVERGTAFGFKRQLAFIGKPLDRKQWFMTPPTVNAYEDPQTNTINFPAGILQPVFFDPNADDVINYGAVGAVIGHELTHGFDDQGRKFDVDGNLRDWWTIEDAKQYEARSSCIADEYTGPVPEVPDVRQNGKLTLGENTADNGGIRLALSALSEDFKTQGKTLEDKDKDGLTNLQRFFLAYGNLWCSQTRPEFARNMVLTDPHSSPELRVNNVVSNMPEFKQAFACKAGQPMVHATQCRVW
jgi:endothelin-converting enzyme/putative endopeptidase